MFQFRRFPSYTYLIQYRIPCGGFPHSEISGSMLICSSPKLIAAYHVLHRLLMPRHSPCALISLTYSSILTWEKSNNWFSFAAIAINPSAALSWSFHLKMRYPILKYTKYFCDCLPFFIWKSLADCSCRIYTACRVELCRLILFKILCLAKIVFITLLVK